VFALDVLCEWHRGETPLLPANAVLRGAVYAVALFLLVFIGQNASEAFIYFQF
jgi:hypothetical protein